MARARTRTIQFFGTLALLCFAVTGCGPASLYDLCKQGCDTGKKCGSLSDSEAADCTAKCNANKGALADEDTRGANQCKNWNDKKSYVSNCITGDCNKVASCLTGEPGCVAK